MALGSTNYSRRGWYRWFRHHCSPVPAYPGDYWDAAGFAGLELTSGTTPFTPRSVDSLGFFPLTFWKTPEFKEVKSFKLFGVKLGFTDSSNQIVNALMRRPPAKSSID